MREAAKPEDGERLLRPSELARAWALHPRTVTAWIKEGRLRAVKTPGQHFRVRASDVRAFCERNGLAVPAAATAGEHRVLVVARAPTAARSLRRALRAPLWHVEDASQLMEGVARAAATRPHVVVFDATLQPASLEAALRALAGTSPETKLFVINAPSAKHDALARAGASLCLSSAQARELPARLAAAL